MHKKKLPPKFLNRVRQVQAKRARTVINHILARGHITTEELKELYGYDHPPRAARDVREQGIPLETFMVKAKSGRTIAAYRFDLAAVLEPRKAGGRRAVSRKLKNQLVEQHQSICNLCGAVFDPKFLQVDHRIPYEVGGESQADKPRALMSLCRSCNRAKSWACEHCKNFKTIKKQAICSTCYWASPNSYEHVGMLRLRRADVAWTGKEVGTYDELRAKGKKAGLSIQQAIKRAVKDSLK